VQWSTTVSLTNVPADFALLVALSAVPSREHLEKHYADLSSRGFFAGLIDYMVRLATLLSLLAVCHGS
jgi:nucleoside diphosphate kinase